MHAMPRLVSQREDSELSIRKATSRADGMTRSRRSLTLEVQVALPLVAFGGNCPVGGCDIGEGKWARIPF